MRTLRINIIALSLLIKTIKRKVLNLENKIRQFLSSKLLQIVFFLKNFNKDFIVKNNKLFIIKNYKFSISFISINKHFRIYIDKNFDKKNKNSIFIKENYI